MGNKYAIDVPWNGAPAMNLLAPIAAAVPVEFEGFAR